jgi:hypothetical protein
MYIIELLVEVPTRGMRGGAMRLPNAAHEAHSWHIGRIAHDFELLDVWALPVEGAAGDFAAFLEMVASFEPDSGRLGITAALFRVRERLGDWLGWDEEGRELPIPGCAESSLRARLPDDLRRTAELVALPVGGERAGGFVPLYRTEREWAAEISNATVHGVVHLGWMELANGRYGAQMAVYVKPRGTLGRVYLAGIAPLRHLVVYPALMRAAGRAWQQRRRRGLLD